MPPDPGCSQSPGPGQPEAQRPERNAGGSGNAATARAALLSPVALPLLCKLHVELDRCEAAREAGYCAALFRMLHAGATAKGDLIVGVPKERPEWHGLHNLMEPRPPTGQLS
ncbi:methyltranfer_dom domain-containing protein [Haematococcus lacustris]|uniref:Methyltranfer_dom domain-containing protein n=1 Tax=Haematococcus lacustris TaxID=44745 RepID=A0A699YVK7_HAELA|nr:methyltranfer_dom domain-containing protein [Haematococcus lacustris]